MNINALRIGCHVCSEMFQELIKIEKNYAWGLIVQDARNNTYIDYLKNFWDPSLLEQQSFCMSGRSDLELRESLTHLTGFCYAINGQEKIFNETR